MGEQNEVELGRQTTYEPMQIDKDAIDHSIGDANTPVHKSYRITLTNVDANVNYVEIKTAKGKTRTYRLQDAEGVKFIEPKYFGTYKMKTDSIGPTVRSVNFSLSTTSYSRNIMQWRIADSQTGIADYDLFIDGKWELLEYDYKSNMVTFDCSAIKGEKEIKVIVVDEVGNITEWKSRINFY